MDRAPGFLTTLNETLSTAPERGDLWMQRFDLLRSLGQKREFAQYLGEGAASQAVRRALDWVALRRMWDEMAPGERFPIDAQDRLERSREAEAAAHDPPPPDLSTTLRRAAAGTPARARRFNDIAVRIAGPQLDILAKEYAVVAMQSGFVEEFARKTRGLLHRPTPLEHSESLSRAAGSGMRIYLKRDDKRGVLVEGEHAAAQCYIGAKLGKSAVVTANDVDLHALETATAARFFGLKCTVVVRPNDPKDKPQLISGLQGLGANVETMPVSGMLTGDPREGALRAWLDGGGQAHLAHSLGMAPPPYTVMATTFQGLLGRETEQQYIEIASMLDRPRTLVAAVSSEADSLGFVLPFLNRRDIRIAYAEPEPGGVASWRPSVRLKPYNGQVREHSWLRGAGRVQHVPVSDDDAAAAQKRLWRDGIRVGVEDARAVALTAILTFGETTPRDFIVLLG